jgi:DNA-binding IclR family transcriptional regulator
MRKTEGSGAIQSVERALRVLDSLTTTPRQRGLRELSAELGCSTTTVHRLLGTLQQFEYVEKDPLTHRYRIGPRAFRLLEAREQDADVRSLSRPHMERLREVSGETLALNLVVGRAFVCLERLESVHGVRWTMPVGASMPLCDLTASAKAPLAFLPAAERAAVLEAVDWEQTRLTRATIEAELAEIRERGVARSFAQRVAGSSSLATPLFERHGYPHAVLAIVGPCERWTAEQMDQVEDDLLRAAREISAALGHAPGRRG